MFHVPEKCRVKSGPFRSDESYGNNGMFTVKRAVGSRVLLCVASDGMEWEHVSVSLDNRCPTWEEMCHIKGIFWDSDDLVVQMHPPKSDYVNRHKFCLHLWRKAQGLVELRVWLTPEKREKVLRIIKQTRSVD